MRTRLISICLGLVAVGALWTTQAFAGQAHASRALPKVKIGSYAGIKPKLVAFSGDGGNIVSKLTWRWTTGIAVGHGISDIQGCVPNCAAGSETPVKATVTFSQPKHGRFTKVVEVRDGARLVGHYGHYSWPEGAS